MQITVAQEMWDNNSICLDVYGKFIYMAQFSANFPVENDKYLVPFAFFFFLQKYCVAVFCLAVIVLPRAILKSMFVYMMKMESLWGCFICLQQNGWRLHHCVKQMSFLLLSTMISAFMPHSRLIFF